MDTQSFHPALFAGDRVSTTRRIAAPLLITVALAPWLALAGGSGATCPTAPIPLDRLNAVIAAATPSTDELIIPTALRPATSGEFASLRMVVEEFVACGDTGEPLRVLPLYTDRYLGEVYHRQGQFTENQYAVLARPDPADADERTRFVSLWKVRALPDGRITGEVEIRYAVIPTSKRLLVTIAPVDGVWRIDDVLGELTFALP